MPPNNDTIDDDPQTKKDDVAEQAAEMIMGMEEEYQEKKAEQEELLREIAEESDVEVIETKCNIIGERVVDITARLDGELLDRMGHIDEQLDRSARRDAPGYIISELVDETCQLLSDLIDDEGWDKDTLYKAYEQNGPDAIGLMFSRVLESISKERERRQGAASGFRPES